MKLSLLYRQSLLIFSFFMAVTIFVVIVQSSTTKQLYLIHGNGFISVQSIKVVNIPSKMTAVLLNFIAVNDIWCNIRLNT